MSVGASVPVPLRLVNFVQSNAVNFALISALTPLIGVAVDPLATDAADPVATVPGPLARTWRKRSSAVCPLTQLRDGPYLQEQR